MTVAVRFEVYAGITHQYKSAVILHISCHQLGIGSHTGIQGVSALCIVSDRNFIISQQFREGRLCLTSAAKVHIALAPVIGHAESDGQHVYGTPYLITVQSQIRTADAHTAHNRNRVRHLKFGTGKHLKKYIFIVGADHHQITATVNYALEQIHHDIGTHINAGIPFQTQTHPSDGCKSWQRLDTDVLCTKADTGHSQCQGGFFTFQNFNNIKTYRQHQLQRRNFLCTEDGIVKIFDTASAAGNPANAQSVNIDTRLESADKDIQLIGNRNVVLTAETYLCFHIECL